MFPGRVIKPALTLARYEATLWHSARHPLIQSAVTDCRPRQRLRLYNSLWLIACDLDVSSGGLCFYFTNILFVRLYCCLFSVRSISAIFSWSLLGLSLIQLVCNENHETQPMIKILSPFMQFWATQNYL